MHYNASCGQAVDNSGACEDPVDNSIGGEGQDYRVTFAGGSSVYKRVKVEKVTE